MVMKVLIKIKVCEGRVFVCGDYWFSFLQLVDNTNISLTSGQERYIQSRYKKCTSLQICWKNLWKTS